MTTEAELTSRLANYLTAEETILKGAQEYVVGQGATARRLTRGDLETIARVIKELRAELAQVQSASSRGRRVVYLRPMH